MMLLIYKCMVHGFYRNKILGGHDKMLAYYYLMKQPDTIIF